MNESTTPTTFKLDVVTNGTTIPFRVVLLDDGKSPNFPAHDKYNQDGKALVEFYDRRYEHTPDGQFVSRYYLDTLLERSENDTSGLNLDGGVADWSVDGATMVLVRSWLRSLT